MKVLFAVSNEEISESIVKRYQKDYKEIISYKNVYYFNAILKELQKDKNYDRIVISEELEAFTNTQYEQIDKFIFDKLDAISDEASNLKGDDIPIILICSDRRSKSEEMFVKLFGIGIYNALIGNDRSVENVCRLLNKPRIKKEAKIYYKIDSDDVSYQPENENDVSEVEIQNILAHYKRLGRDEKKYVDSFDNIASQYNDVQLRIISKFLPLNIRAVLEEKSPKYQEIISFNSRVSDNLRASVNIEGQKQQSGTSEKLLKSSNSDNIIQKSVVIPSAINSNGPKKLVKAKPQQIEEFEDIENLAQVRTVQGTQPTKPVQNVQTVQKVQQAKPVQSAQHVQGIQQAKPVQSVQSVQGIQQVRPVQNTQTTQRLETIQDVEEIPELQHIQDDMNINEYESISEEQIVEPIIEQPKRGRGRPRKTPVVVQNQDVVEQPKRGRGRPKKVPAMQEIQEENILPDMVEETDIEDEALPEFNNDYELNEVQISEIDNNVEEDTLLPGFDDDYEQDEIQEEQSYEDEILPGYDNDYYEDETKTYEDVEEDTLLPGFDNYEQNDIQTNEIDEETEEDILLPGFDNDYEQNNMQVNEIDEETEEDALLPGFDNDYEQNDMQVNEIDEESEDTLLPGISEVQDEENNEEYDEEYDNDYDLLPGIKNNSNNDNNTNINNSFDESVSQKGQYQDTKISNIQSYTKTDISYLLTSTKKIACFVGTSKNGTSFVINNLAQITSSMGIDTAIFDATKNRNSYYIYTKNEEQLRRTAMNSINNLLQGDANGIKANKNLTIYTSLPDETKGIENAGKILETLLKKHSLILIDCDFDTPIEYFEKTQEIYLVQSFDVLTIQPLTAFLRELKAKNIFVEQKLRIVLNKAVKLRGINDKTIVGGMAYYNDPAMSFMTELFNKNVIKYISIPFDEEAYVKYLEGIINCEISIKGYNKKFIQVFNELSNMVYPLVSGKSTYVPPKIESANAFTPNMNSTLEQMKNRY